jgi:hypothetical protein
MLLAIQNGLEVFLLIRECPLWCRYLIFFDDGYAQYVTHEKILLVCESSRNVWEDIHPDSKEFIRKYLEQYPERPMVKLQQGQIVKTEWNGNSSSALLTGQTDRN